MRGIFIDIGLRRCPVAATAWCGVVLTPHSRLVRGVSGMQPATNGAAASKRRER